MNDDADTITESVCRLQDRSSQVSQDLAVLSMMAIAHTVRVALPGAAEAVLTWSGQGPLYLVSTGRYLTADGTGISAPDELDEAIRRFCGNLNEDNEGTWMPFVSGETSDGGYRLKIDDLLSACETGRADRDPARRTTGQAGCHCQPRKATVTLTLDAVVYAEGDAAAVNRAICDHLRVVSTDDAVVQLTGQTGPQGSVLLNQQPLFPAGRAARHSGAAAG